MDGAGYGTVELERRMRPGAWDAAGFLDAGEGLNARMRADTEACEALSTTPEQLGRALAELLTAGSGSDLMRPARVGPYRVTILRKRGLITCPWAEEEFRTCPAPAWGNATANRFRVERGRAKLEGFELSAHMVAAHGFFGGASSRFRLEPAALARLLAKV